MSGSLFNPLGLSRRQFLKTSGLLLGAAHLPASFAAPITATPRVAALEWAAVEMLAILGLAPVAVSDKQGYRDWVSAPPLSPQVTELGLRSEPNLELLAGLKPDLLILPQQAALPTDRLEKIAPLWQYPFITQQHGPLPQARNNILSLAQRLQRHAQATAWLQGYDLQQQQFQQQFRAQRGTRVLMFTLMTPRQALVLTADSLFGQVLTECGLHCAWQGATSVWGSVIVGIEQLLTCETDLAVMFSHDNDQLLQSLPHSPLWQQMPFVRQQRCYTLPPVWMYGSLMSAQRFTSQLANVLRRENA